MNSSRKSSPLYVLIAVSMEAILRTERMNAIQFDEAVAFRLHAQMCGYPAGAGVNFAEFGVRAAGGPEVGKSINYIISAAHTFQGRGMYTLSEAHRVFELINEIIQIANGVQPPAPAPAKADVKASADDDDIEVIQIASRG